MIINCPNCGKKISSTCKTCVHCGYKLVNKSKVKWLPFVIGGVVLLSAVIFFLLFKNISQTDSNTLSKKFSEMVNQYDYVSSCFPFNDETNVICVGKEGKYGLLSTKGELVVPCEYDAEIYVVSDSAHAFCVKKNGRFGLMNNKGEVVLPCEYDSRITLLNEAYNKYIADVTKNNQIGLVNLQNFCLIAPCEYEFNNTHFAFRDENLLWINKNERYALIDGNGNKLTDFIYSYVFPVSEYDVCPVCKNGEWGFVNKEGREIPSSFGCNRICYSSMGKAAFEGSDYYDSYGKRISESELYDGLKTVYSVVGSRYGNTGGKYNQGNSFCGGFAIVYKYDSNADKSYYGLINEQGEEVIPLTSDGRLDNDLLEDGYVVKSYYNYLSDDNQQMGVLDTKGNIIIPCEYQTIIHLGQGLFVVKENEVFRLFKANKGFVSDVRYNSVSDRFGFEHTRSPFALKPLKKNDNTYNELIAVESLSGDWGIVDKNGNTITKCVYEELRYSPYPIVLVKKGDKWGLVSITGQEIAPCEYDEMDDFSCGLARVKKGEQYGFVDVKGNSTFSK